MLRYSGSTGDEEVNGELNIVQGTSLHATLHVLSVMHLCIYVFMCLHVLSAGSGCEAADYVANTVALVNYTTNETLVGCSLFEIVSHKNICTNYRASTNMCLY